jgi:hypothetical protein
MEEQLLKEYVGTYLNPKYNGDWDVVNSKFPELSGVDKQILKEYVGTYLNPKYNGDWNVVNSKFPELFPVGKSSAERPVAAQPEKKNVTASPFVDGGLEPTKSEPTPNKLNDNRDFSSLAVQVDEKLLTKTPRESRPVVSQDVTTVARLPKTQTLEVEENKKYIKETERLKNEAQNLEKLKEAEQQDLFKQQNILALQDPELGSLITQINKDLIDKEEGEVTDFLNKKFSKFGFHFESTGVGDAVIARTIDGKKSIEIDLDPLLESTEIEESEKLRKFISSNSQAAYNYKDEDYITKAVRAQSLRELGMKNDDGTESTVKFTSFEQDGKHFVIPTLFPKNPFDYSSEKKDWLDLPFDQALNEARLRGEVFEFDNEADAQKFAEGDWKNVNAFDIEGQRLYRSKGLDYYTEKKKFENYTALQDEVELLEKVLDRDVIAPEEKLKYPQYFAKDGRPLYSEKELEGRLDKTIAKKDQLLEQVFDVEFLGINDGPIQKTREEFDLVLDKKQKEIQAQAIKQNNEANSELEQVNLTSMNLYGVPIEKLYTVAPKTSQDVKTINDLVIRTKELIAVGKDAANKFEVAKTYYDAKWNKAATEEYEENFSGFKTALADALENGRAAEQILLTTLGIKDVDINSDKKDIAAKIAEASSNLSGKQSRVLTRLNLSRDGEFLKTLMSDPLEAISTFTASSFTQILPYGSYIIPTFVASGIATGAAIGGSTGGAPGAVAGAAAGLGYGARAGMSASFFALEYTNSILDVMKEKGYDITDPLQVEKGLMDESVWSEGGERGVKRGIPIAIVNYLSAGLAGKIFKVSKIAPTATRVGALAAERVLIDPTFEMAGEFAAQKTAGQEVNLKDIAYEGLGGIGSNTSMMGLNMYLDSRNQTSALLALELTDINTLASQRVSDERISNWANNMQQLGKIDADVNQRIQQNVGLRREARDLLSVGSVSRLTGNTSKSEARVMELLAARQELTSTQNRREVNSDKIKAINQELAELSENKKVKPKEEQVNLDLILGTKREGVSRYQIGGKVLSKEQFNKEIANMSAKNLLRSKIKVDNDEETQIEILNKQLDAIQKQAAGEVPVQPGATVSEEVAQGEPQAELEILTPEGQVQEEVNIERKAENKDTEVKNISFNKEQTTVNDEGYFDLAFEGSLLDDYDFLAQGTESKVYLSKDKSHVIKLSEPYTSKDPNVYEKRVTTGLLKDIFGDSGVEVVGYYEYNGTKNPIFRQDYIEGQPLTEKESEDYLRSNKRVVEIDNKFYTKYNDVLYRVSDFENNLIRDNSGKVVPIDLNISEVKDSKIIDRYDSEVSALQPQVVTQEEVVQEVTPTQQLDLEGEVSLLEQLLTSNQQTQPRARLSAGVETQDTRTSEADVVSEINQMAVQSPEEAAFEGAKPTGQVEAGQVVSDNPTPDNIKKPFLKRILNKLGFTKESQLYRRIEEFSNIPMMIGISDSLGSGTYKDAAGNDMEIDGGLMFNFFRNLGLAWANVDKKLAQNIVNQAKQVYTANKELFDRLWKEGTLPDGHIPYSIVRMGDDALYSNEAIFRYLSPWIKTLPLENRKAALEVYKQDLMKAAKGQSSSSWIFDLQDNIDNGNITDFKGIIDYLESLKNSDVPVATKDAIQSLENKLNKIKGEEKFSDSIEAIDEILSKKAPIRILNFIEEKNITTVDGLFDAIVDDAISRAKGGPSMLSLPVRAIISTKLLSLTPLKKDAPTTEFNKALLGREKNPLWNDAKKLTLPFIKDQISEPAMLKARQGDIVAVMGIDVREGSSGVEKAQHNNYGYGPKGMLISYISNPTRAFDVFAELQAKAPRLLKKNKSGVYPTADSIVRQAGGTAFIDVAFRGAKIKPQGLTDIDIIVGKLRTAFPDVSVFDTKEEFDNFLQQEGIRSRADANGNVIYGITKDGKIFINPDNLSLRTPVHEFGHIWVDYLRSKASGNKGTALLNRGLQLVDGTPEYKEALAKYGQRDIALEEALVELIATKGETIVNASKKSEFKNWLNAFFKYIKEKFITTKELFKDKDFVSRIEKMTLDEFINSSLADLFGMAQVNRKFKASEAKAASRARLGESDINNIVQVGLANGISDAAIREVLNKRGFTQESIDAALGKEAKAAKKVEVTEEFAPGYDRVLNNMFGKDGIVAKSRKRGVSNEDTISNAINYLRKTKVYQNATDVQREAMERNVNKELNKREKSAPSAEKVVGKPKKQVTVDEMAALKDQIKLEARAAREAKADLNTKRRMIADAINKMATEGKITTNRAEAIVKRASRLNVDSEVSVNKFIDYVSKVFADAEYTSKLSTGNTLRKKIKSVSNNKDKAANLRDLGVKFSEIDPSMVEDIEQYNTIAKKIFESINGSTLRGGVKFADIVKISDVSDYINDAIEKQNKEILNNKIAEMSELLGIEITEDEYFMLMESINNNKELPKKYKDGAIRKAINKAFDVYSAMINQMLDAGVDPITGEDISIDVTKKKVVRRFMNMDFNILSDKEALAAIDSLLNFIQNGSTAKMSAVYNRNLGEQNAIKLDKKNFKSSKIKKYFSENLGQFLVEQFTQLDIVMERMFKGVEKAGEFMFEAGISALKKGKSTAKSINNKIVDNYFNTFYKSKPNNQDFNTLFNTIERGITANVMRTVTGTESEINAEFKKKKSLLEQSIENLKKGKDKHKKLAEVYTEVYEKILKDSNNYDEVVSKADPKNVEAVKFWQGQWANRYQDLSDLSESIYNKTLGNDLNYTPIKVSNIGIDQKVDEDSDEMNKYAMSLHSNNQTSYQRETGVLMAPTMDDKLPKGGFIDLSFDSNNANSMYDALVDLNTADAVRQISGFFNSDAFENIVPNIDDRKILKGRVNLFIRNIRNKSPYDNDEFAKVVSSRAFQNLAALGAGRALAGPTQALKQTVPVIANTIVNAGSIDLTAPFDKSKNDFIDNSGYAIANRSAATINQIETLNRLSNNAANSLVGNIVDPLFKLNDLQLKYFLQKPDNYVARASWITYYEKYLKDNKLYETTVVDKNTASGNFKATISGIDYATHELNDKAADYAQRMVDRQQNVSDMDLAGKFIGSKNALAQFVNKTMMPFSSFRINQSARLGSDWSTLTSKVSTKEDKVTAARSLGGFFVELASFRAVSATISVVLASLAALISGKEDDEKDREKLFDTIIKGSTTSTIIDIVSFLPYMDGLFQSGISKGLDVVQDMLEVEDADKFPFYDPRDKSVLEGLGMLGIAGQRADDFIHLIDVAYTRDYKDDFGRTKYISEEDSDILKNFVMLNILSSVGIASPEIKTMTRRTLANVKRRSTTNESGIKGKKVSSGSGRSSRGRAGRANLMNKSDMKKYFPELNKQLESATGGVDDQIKKIEKQQRDLKKSIKDQVYGGKD